MITLLPDSAAEAKVLQEFQKMELAEARSSSELDPESHESEDRIVGGRLAKLGELPFMARLVIYFRSRILK